MEKEQNTDKYFRSCLFSKLWKDYGIILGYDETIKIINVSTGQIRPLKLWGGNGTPRWDNCKGRAHVQGS